MVSEAVQTNGINNGNNYSPYIVSSNNLQLKHTQQNIVVIPQPHSMLQNSLPPNNDPLPGVTSRPQMSSQTLANQFNLSDISSRQSTNQYLQQATPAAHQIPPHLANKFPGYKLQVYDIDGEQENKQHKYPNQQQVITSSVPLHQVNIDSKTPGHSGSTSRLKSSTTIDKKTHNKVSHHTHTHQHHHHNTIQQQQQHIHQHQHIHHKHGMSNTHHTSQVKHQQVGQSQYRSSPKHRRGIQHDGQRTTNKLQKSRSDGQLLDDSIGGQSTDQSTMSTGSHSHKGVEGVNTTAPIQSAKQPLESKKYSPLQADFEKRFIQHPPLSCSEEEEISDRDMPELAPISQHEHVHMVSKANVKSDFEYVHRSSPCKTHESLEVVGPRQSMSSSLIHPHHNVATHSCQLTEDQNLATQTTEYAEDIDRDLGQALSPLGSTSSLQDLIESVSVPSRGDGSSKSEKLIATSLWAEQTRALHAEQLPPVTESSRESITADQSMMYTNAGSSQVPHDIDERDSKKGNKIENWNQSVESTIHAPQHEEKEPSTSSLKSSKSGKKMKTVKVVAPEDIDADSGRGTSEDMHQQPHYHNQRSKNATKQELRKPEESYQTSIVKTPLLDNQIKLQKEETEPCIEVEEESTGIILRNDSVDEKSHEKCVTSEADVVEEEPFQHYGAPNFECSPRNVSCSDTTESFKGDPLSSESFQAIEEREENVDPSSITPKVLDSTDVFEEIAKDISTGTSTEEIRADDDNIPFLKDADIVCEDEFRLETNEKEIRDEEIKEETELKGDQEELEENIDTSSKSSEKKTLSKQQLSSPERSSSSTNNITSESGMIWQKIQGERGDVRKKAQAFEQKIQNQSLSIEDNESESKEKSLPSSRVTSGDGEIKLSQKHTSISHVEKIIDENIMSPELGRSDDETTSQHVDSESVFRSSCDEDEVVAKSSPTRKDDEGSIGSSSGRPQSARSCKVSITSPSGPPPIAPKPKIKKTASPKDPIIDNSETASQHSNEPKTQGRNMPTVAEPSVEPNIGAPLVEPPAGFGDSPVKNIKIVEIKEIKQTTEFMEEYQPCFTPEEKIEEKSIEIVPVIKETILPKQQFANVEILPSIDHQTEIVESTNTAAHQGPMYHRPAEMQIEELTSLSSAIEIAPLQSLPNRKKSIEKNTEFQTSVPLKEEEPSLAPTQLQDPITTFRVVKDPTLKEFSPIKQRQVGSDRKQRPSSRKSSSGSKERCDTVTSGSASSMQSPQVCSHIRRSPTNVTTVSKAKIRSRSSSKERLLSTLANSADAPVTSHSEDDIAGKTL